MTGLHDFAIDAANPSSLRVGIKWDPLERDRMEEKDGFHPKKDNKIKLFLMNAQMVYLWIMAFLCRLTLIFWFLAKRFGAARKKLKAKQIVLKKYIAMRHAHSFDLDLCCFCFGQDGKPIGHVLPTVTEMFGKEGWDETFHHSGDDVTGTRNTFDEELMVNLFKVDPRIDQIIFLIVSVNHGFNQIKGGSWSIITTSDETEKMRAELKTKDVVRLHIMAGAKRHGPAWTVREIAEFRVMGKMDGVTMQERVNQLLTKYYVIKE